MYSAYPAAQNAETDKMTNNISFVLRKFVSKSIWIFMTYGSQKIFSGEN